ncbi:MAG TPA: Shedu immune nuclease family protein, partial [Candidatus Saccharimonadales bacterium]|nr:Shedu immune nuclease family protein [Candidatus Saccharimonadales bacterium]
ADLFLLIFPQYIAILHKVNLKESYSDPSKSTRREIDLMLVDANGGVDLIEIKKPFDDKVLARGVYRDNYIPHGELSGAIMQAEKYLFYLSKGGRDIEKTIQTKYRSQLPAALEIKIANPKSIILHGRDHKLSPEQKFDLGIIRKKYSNMVDILTYDDLLRRIDNIIAMLKVRAGS